jgi:hypothetical protein
MVGNDEDRCRSRKLCVEDRGWSSTGQVLSGRTIKRSGDAGYGLHCAQGDKKHGFFGLASKPRSTVSPSLASKSVATVFVFWSQNHSLGFPGLDLKTGSYDLMI